MRRMGDEQKLTFVHNRDAPVIFLDESQIRLHREVYNSAGVCAPTRSMHSSILGEIDDR